MRRVTAARPTTNLFTLYSIISLALPYPANLLQASKNMFSRKTRFSVLQLMVATVVIAVFSVALFNDNEWWRATLGTITMAMILNALLASIFTKGERWAFSLSYFVGAVFFTFGVYTYAASLPYLLTVKAYELVKAYASSPPNNENFLIVAVIFWIQITCYSSGIVGRAWYRKTLAENAASALQNQDEHSISTETSA